MTTREYALRIIVVDEALFIYHGHEHPPQLTALNGQDSAAARRLLRLDLPTIDACPARSAALAAPDKASKAYLLTPLSRGMLLHLRDMAAVSDPFTVTEWAVLHDRKESSISSIISQLHGRGYLQRTADRPMRYLVTPAGHQLLVEASQ